MDPCTTLTQQLASLPPDVATRLIHFEEIAKSTVSLFIKGRFATLVIQTEQTNIAYTEFD